VIDRDERAVSTVVGYTLGVGITVILISGLLISMGTLVEDQREQTVRSELKVVGQKLAASVTAVDRLVTAGTVDGASLQAVNLTHHPPETVAGLTYTITLHDDPSGPALELKTRNPDITATVTMATTTPVSTSSVGSGTVRIEYNGTSSTLEIQDV
jgi:FlaG/FlaF family flagellin (archaellin)